MYTRDWRPWVKLAEMDLGSGARLLDEDEVEALAAEQEKKGSWRSLPVRVVRSLF